VSIPLPIRRSTAALRRRGQSHGVIYEFLRNDHLNANSWQNNRTNVRRNLFQRNEYGAAVGGRIIRDRPFFFVNYEAQRQRTLIDFVATFPTIEQRQGDFSRTLDSTGRPVIMAMRTIAVS